MITRRELWNAVRAAAEAVYDRNEAQAVTAYVCEGRFGLRFTDVVVEPSAPMPERDDLSQVLAEIRDHRPAQYITGWAYFAGRKIAVREGVLIPRPETEEMVQHIVRRNASRRGLSVLDVGTGSGCIAVTLASELPDARLTALDVSATALEVMSENAERCGVQVRALCCDVLHSDPDGRYDLIVSNPPYVTNSERQAMLPNVLRYEPHRALFVDDDDPLLFYRAIAQMATRVLKPQATLWFEINERFGEQVCCMLNDERFERVALHADLFGKPRVVEALWNQK